MRLLLKAGATYFALVFGTGFLLGMIRIPFLVPRLGIRAAELIEMPFMLVAIALAAHYVVRRFALPHFGPDRAAVGFVALALMAAAELTLAELVNGLSPSQYVASRDVVSAASTSWSWGCSRSCRVWCGELMGTRRIPCRVKHCA